MMLAPPKSYMNVTLKQARKSLLKENTPKNIVRIEEEGKMKSRANTNWMCRSGIRFYRRTANRTMR